MTSLNINSLLKHLDEIRALLSNSLIEILAINESKIDDSVLDREINIVGYNLVRKNRNRYGGGVVLYIRNNISYAERKDLVPNNLEMVCVEVSRPHNRSFLISTWYRPPNSHNDVFDKYDEFLRKCDLENKELMVIGDINCDFAKSLPDLHTRRLQLSCSLYQLDQLINEPTRVTETSATLIDLFLTNRPDNISNSGVIHLGISDHSMIFAVKKITVPKFRETIREVRDYKKFIENDFIHDIAQVPWDIICQFDDPNVCWQAWKSVFLEIIDRHAPLRHKKTKVNSVPWITPKIKQSMRKRDFHKKQAIKNNSQLHWDIYKSERNRVNVEMRNAKAKFFGDKIRECSESKDIKKSWNLINTLLGRNIKSATVNELFINNRAVSDDNHIAEAFNEYFINIGPKLAAEVNDSTNQACPDTNSELYSGVHCLGSQFIFSEIDQNNVTRSLKLLKVSKATGVDNIPAKILKMSADIIAPSLTAIFNLSLNSGVYIDAWKQARITPIYKSEDRRKCENYRPISILPVISKIFEKQIFDQLYDYLAKNSLLSKFQSGFRPKHSTMSALIQMCDQWLENMDNGMLNGVVFLDIRKAFDSINHSILLNKMNDQFGVQGLELKWFDSYLTNREQVCVVNGRKSSSMRIICGVPQGSILGPLLFLLYINDMPKCLQCTTPCLYADDTEIFSSSHDFDKLIENLNTDLKNIHNWLAKNKLQHHPTKSKLMFIGSSYNLKNKVGEGCVYLGDKPVPRTGSQKCLGVEIDENLSWEKQIEAICKKVGAGIGAIKRAKPYVESSTLQTIYNALVQPYFDYCSILWGNCGKSLQDKLQKFQSRAARVITGATYEIRSADVLDNLSWETLNVRRSNTKATYMYKILNDHTAPNLKESFGERSATQNTYNLRNNDVDLALLKPKTEFLKRTFKYSGAILWNDLPRRAKSANTLDCFKRNIHSN